MVAKTTSIPKAEDTAPAPFVLPKISLLEAYEPVVKAGGGGRHAAPNPFAETVQALVGTWDDGLRRSRSGARLVFESTEGERRRVTTKFSAACKAAGFSPSYDDKADERGKSVVVAYLVPKITRNRTPKEETATK